jgi:hypothetical protein
LGKQYYFKFIHNRNQSMFMNGSIDSKAPTFVPFEAGRKVPINERVQYYIDKMISEEEEAKKQVNEKSVIQQIKSQVSMVEDSQEELVGLTDQDASQTELLPQQSKNLESSPLRGMGSPSRKNNTQLPSLIRNSVQTFSLESDQQITLRNPESTQNKNVTKKVQK